MKKICIVLFFALPAATWSSCSTTDTGDEQLDDSDEPSNSDGDGDSDLDADGDSDGDGDSDADGDSDSDGDGDSDADSDDTDGGSDGDTDGDGDGDTDGDADTDGDTDTDTDGDTDTDADGDSEELCEYACQEHCRSLDGTEMPGTCDEGLKCCDMPEDTGADADADADTDADTDTDTDTDADADADADPDVDPLDPDGVVTGPAVVDPDDAAAGLPQYYISNTGDDGNSGTSPEDAWATIANIPSGEASAVYFERGGTFEAVGGTARGRDGPAAFNAPAGSVWTAYGDGDAPPLLEATIETADKPTGAVLSPGGNSLIEGLSLTGKANFGLLIMTDENVIQNCEIDGNLEDNWIQLGFSIRGNNNLVVGNYIHSLHEVILDSGNVNTSGGAEGIVVNGTNHEIAYNKLEDLWTPNETLGGAEGGCLEIIARSPGEVVENIQFHHNYCERSVGLFEACAGNFDGTPEKIQEHHAAVKDTTLAYNVVMDAMWLYLLQTANTDFDGLVFEHNTLVHGPANTDIPQQGAAGFGNFYDTDRFIPEQSCSAASDCGNGGENRACFGGKCYYQFLAEPGTITVRNNLFVVLPDATAATMKLPPGPDDFIDNIFSPKAPQGVEADRATIVTDPGLVDNTYFITADSPAVDQAGNDSVKAWPDFDGSALPCGDAPDIGAIEFCP